MSKRRTEKRVASEVVRKLKREGFIVQRYDSFTTTSIYLKLDYGACHTIRISDHAGKPNVKHKYFIDISLRDEAPSWEYEGQFNRGTFSPKTVDQLIEDAVKLRKRKIKSFKHEALYYDYIYSLAERHQGKKGFWELAKIV